MCSFRTSNNPPTKKDQHDKTVEFTYLVSLWNRYSEWSINRPCQWWQFINIFQKRFTTATKNGIKSHFSHFAMYSFKFYSITLCLEQVLNRTEVWRRDLRSKRNSYYSPEPIAFFRIKPFTEIGTCQSWARHVMDICGRKHIWNQKEAWEKLLQTKQITIYLSLG